MAEAARQTDQPDPYDLLREGLSQAVAQAMIPVREEINANLRALNGRMEKLEGRMEKLGSDMAEMKADMALIKKHLLGDQP